MSSYNRCILLGNTTRDIELRYIASGTAVCDLGLAVSDRVKKGGEWTEEVVYIDCTCWGRTAEIANEYLQKGSPVLVEGRLKLEQWESNGQRRSKLKVVVEKLQLLGSKGKGKRQQQDNEYSQPATVGADDSDGSDIPF